MGLRIFVGGTWQVEKPEKGTCQVEKLQTSPQINMKPQSSPISQAAVIALFLFASGWPVVQKVFTFMVRKLQMISDGTYLEEGVWIFFCYY